MHGEKDAKLLKRFSLNFVRECQSTVCRVRLGGVATVPLLFILSYYCLIVLVLLIFSP